jgi:hypothetical protein
MKRILLLMSFILLNLSSSAIEKDSLSLGLSWNYRTKYMKNGEIYLLFREALFRSSDSRIGINFRNYSLNFDGVHNLQASSIGLGAEESVYLYKKILFLGIRFDLSGDWLSRASKDKIELERQYEMPLLYYNFTGYLEAGVNLELIKGCNLKLSVMPGVEDRGITNELPHLGVSNQTNIVREGKNNYLIQINLSIEFKLKK